MARAIDDGARRVSPSLRHRLRRRAGSAAAVDDLGIIDIGRIAAAGRPVKRSTKVSVCADELALVTRQSSRLSTEPPGVIAPPPLPRRRVGQWRPHRDPHRVRDGRIESETADRLLSSRSKVRSNAPAPASNLSIVAVLLAALVEIVGRHREADPRRIVERARSHRDLGLFRRRRFVAAIRSPSGSSSCSLFERPHIFGVAVADRVEPGGDGPRAGLVAEPPAAAPRAAPARPALRPAPGGSIACAARHAAVGAGAVARRGADVAEQGCARGDRRCACRPWRRRARPSSALLPAPAPAPRPVDPLASASRARPSAQARRNRSFHSTTLLSLAISRAVRSHPLRTALAAASRWPSSSNSPPRSSWLHAANCSHWLLPGLGRDQRVGHPRRGL